MEARSHLSKRGRKVSKAELKNMICKSTIKEKVKVLYARVL
jgi:hypothetical protein